MDAYVINLKHRTDRWKAIQSLLSKVKSLKSVHRFDAVVGKDLDLSTVNIREDLRYALRVEERFSPLLIDSVGAVGASLSHIGVWKQVVNTLQRDTDWALVLEDDATFKHAELDQVLEILPNAPFEYVHMDSMHPLPSTSGSVSVGRVEFQWIKPWSRGGSAFYGAAAYALTRRVAQTLLDTCFPLDVSIDHFIMRQLGAQSIPIAFRHVVKQDAFWKGNDIRHDPFPKQKQAGRIGFLVGCASTLCVVVVVILLAAFLGYLKPFASLLL